MSTKLYHKISRASRSMLQDQRPRLTQQDQQALRILQQYWF